MPNTDNYADTASCRTNGSATRPCQFPTFWYQLRIGPGPANLECGAAGCCPGCAYLESSTSTDSGFLPLLTAKRCSLGGYMSIGKRLETITISAVVLIAVGISVADLIGALDGVGWLRTRIPVITLLVVGAMSAYLIEEQYSASRNQAGVLTSAVQQAIDALNGVEVREFPGRAEFWEYAAKRIRSSNATIDDLTWGLIPLSARTPQDEAAYREYRRAIEVVSTGKGGHKNTVYREIMTFPDGRRLPRARALMHERYPNFQLRYYDYDHAGTPLLVQYYVFDRMEVLISLVPPSLNTRYMSFRNRYLADLLSDYFDAVWQDAIVLKGISTIKTELLDEITKRIESMGLSGPKLPY